MKRTNQPQILDVVTDAKSPTDKVFDIQLDQSSVLYIQADGKAVSTTFKPIVKLTQVQYDAIVTPDPDTLYVIIG